jgi:hypothetical protein
VEGGRGATGGVRRRRAAAAVVAVVASGALALGSPGAGGQDPRSPSDEAVVVLSGPGLLSSPDELGPSSDWGPAGGTTAEERDRGVSVAQQGDTAAAQGADRVPCPAVRADGLSATGGCAVDARGGRVSFRVLSAVGVIEFANCRVAHTIYMDRGGRTLVDDFAVHGQQPCSDIDACWKGDDREQSYPWKGRLIRYGGGSIRAGGGDLRHDVQACFDTCMGRFEGIVSISLDPTARDWSKPDLPRSRRATAPGRTLGSSGLQLDAAWTIDMYDVDIKDLGFR